MAAVSDSINLQDNVSPILRNLILTMNSTITALEQMRSGFDKPIAEGPMQAARAQIENLNRSLEQLQGDAEAARQGMQEMSGQSQNTREAFGSLSSSVSGLVMAFGGMKIFSAVKDGFASASSAAMEFESAVTGIYKTVEGTPQQLAALSDAVRTMATEIPSSTTEIAGVMESAGQLGIATENVTDFARTMIDLANSTNLTSESAASSLAKFANVTVMDPSQYKNLGSAIFELGNNFATTEADIVGMASHLASAGSLAGMSQADILGLSTTMSSLGISLDAGASSMSRLITETQIAVETGNNLEKFASVANMSSEQFVNAFQTNAVGAIQAFISGLNDVERNGASTAVILDDLGLNEIRLSNTVRALAGNSGLMSSAVSAASKAWQENTALTNEAGKRYDTLESRLQMTRNAANNLKETIGSTLNPVLGSLSDTAREAFISLDGFAKENPNLTAGIAGTVGTIGTLVGGIGAVAPTVSYAVDAMGTLKDSFGMFKNLTMGKFLGGAGIALGVAGLIGGGISYLISKDNNTVKDYNGTLKQCRTELEKTQAEYKNVCSTYGSTSAAAAKLADDINLLNAQYEKGGGAAEEYAQSVKESAKAFEEYKNSYQEQLSAVTDSEISGQIMYSQLKNLSEKSQKTTTDLDLMASAAERLNKTFNLNVEVDYNTGDVKNLDSVEDTIKSWASDGRYRVALGVMTDEEKAAKYAEAIWAREDALKKMKTTEDEMKKIASDPSYVYSEEPLSVTSVVLPSEIDGDEPPEIHDTAKTYAELSDDLKKFQTAYNEASSAMKDYEDTYIAAGMRAGYSFKDTQDQLNLIKDGFTGVTEATGGVMGPVTQEAAAAAQTYKTEMEKLQETYEEAYESAKKSIEGTFKLFEKADMSMKDTLSLSGEGSALDMLQSQMDYFNKYEEAIKKLSELRLDNNIIAQLNPEQAVKFMDELNEMDSGKAKDKIDELNNKFSDLSKVKESVEQELAKISTDYDNKAKEITDKLNVPDDAAAAADTTMSAYVSELTRQGEIAALTAESIARRVSIALSSTNISVKQAIGGAVNALDSVSVQIPGFASGTLRAPGGLTMVGENGPELVYMSGGERVFNNPETRKILENMSGGNIQPQIYIPKTVQEAADISLPDIPSIAISAPAAQTVTSTDSYAHSVKDVNITINGENIPVTASLDRAAVTQIIQEHVVPVVMKTLEGEIFEEGDGYYVY